jgi:hypothetical protein
MAKSKDFILPFWPKDFSNIIREGKGADSVAFRPGDLVVRDGSNLLVLADESNINEPKQVVWTDIANRFDVDGFELDGTAFKRVTVVEGEFQADCNIASMFTGDTPAIGDIVLPSATPGKLVAMTTAEAKAGGVTGGATDGVVEGLQVGRIVGEAEISGSGFTRVHFNLA